MHYYCAVFYTCAGLFIVNGSNQVINDAEKNHVHNESQLSEIKQMEKQLKTFNERFDQIQQENKELQNKVSRLTEENKELRGEVSKVQHETHELIENEKEFQMEVLRLTEENQELQSKVSKLTELRREVSTVKSENHLLREEVSRLTEENTEIRHDVMQLNDSMTVYISHTSDKHNTGFVSFTAYATETREYNSGDLVIFDGVVTNYGGLYDPTTSIFTCPYSGYYMFSVAVLSFDTGHPIRVEITIDDTGLVTARALDSTTWDQGFSMVTTLCETGQQVWIRCTDSANKMQGNYLRESTFHGSLLRIQ